MNWQNKTKFCIHIIIDKIFIGIVNYCFLQICNRVRALDWCQNLVFSQYLENELTKCDQILYTHYHWQDLGWDCKASIFANLQQSYDPWLTSEFGPTMDCGVSCPWPIEKIFYLLENYLEILACWQVSDRCPLGYLFPFVILNGICIDSYLNILKSHWWNCIKPCKHIPIFKTNTNNKNLRARGQCYKSYFPLWFLIMPWLFSDFSCFDMSLLLLTVTLRGVSNKHCLLSFFFIYINDDLGVTLTYFTARSNLET